MGALRKGFVATCVLLACGALLYFFLIGPSYFESSLGYSEVLQQELPEGIHCVGQQMNTSGRERRMYDYRVVFRGNTDVLLNFLELLELSEKDLGTYSGPRYMRKEPMAWWTPPSVTGEAGYRLFQKSTGRLNAPGERFLLVQAELATNRLYMVQFGDIETLESGIEGKQGHAEGAD